MYLSFSGFKKFGADEHKGGCHFAYWNSYINKTKIEGLDDRLGSIFGSAIGTIFEDFYNDKLWKLEQPRSALYDLVEPTVKRIIAEETTTTSEWRQAGVLRWKGDDIEAGQNPKGTYANLEELMADVRDAVHRGVQIIKHYRLLGPVADSEVKLDAVVKGHKLGGRADFIIKRTKPHRDLCIIDGKGSKWRDKYVDRRQLLWYGMLYKGNTGETPEKLGFLFWKFAPPESIDWIAFTDDDLDELMETVLATIDQIETLKAQLPAKASFEDARKVFLPLADMKASKADKEQECRFCPYATEECCPGGYKVAKKFQR